MVGSLPTKMLCVASKLPRNTKVVCEKKSKPTLMGSSSRMLVKRKLMVKTSLNFDAPLKSCAFVFSKNDKYK